MKNNLKQLRTSNNLDTKQLSELLGVSLRTYQNYEKGTTEMSYYLLLKISKFFNCSIDYLLCNENNAIIYKDSFTEPQQNILALIPKLNTEQSIYLLGRITEMLGLPYSSTKPVKPW